MAVEVVPYTPEWEAAVARFNRRMRDGNAPSAFGIPEHVGAPRTGLVHSEHFLAVEGPEVRGGIIILEHPAFIRPQHSANISEPSHAGAGARRETVINLQSPLSEAIIDSKYALVSIQLIRFALKRCSYAYVVGMGSARNPLPRLLKASGWNVRPVPFFFRVLRPARCLLQLEPLKRKPALRAAALIGAYSGLGGLALRFLQRRRSTATGFRIEKVTGADVSGQRADDHVWSAIERRLSFGVVRDSSTMASYLSSQLERYRVYRGDDVRGWFTVLVSSMRDHSYFGSLRVATLVDMAAEAPDELAAFPPLVVECAQATGCDLVVSNQLQAESQDALRLAGFLSYSSNYLLATSKALSAVMEDVTSFVTRQDGDGLVNLRGPHPSTG